LTDDAAVRRLNATWRGLDKPTNVLSFPAAEAPAPRHLGDIAIAFETTAREAKDEGKPLADHLTPWRCMDFSIWWATIMNRTPTRRRWSNSSAIFSRA